MTYKKERAGLAAMLLMSQVVLLLFTLEATIVKNVSITSVLLPLVIVQASFVIILIALTVIGYYLIPVTKYREVYSATFCGIGVVFWLITLGMMKSKAILGGKETMFIVLECFILVMVAGVHIMFSPKDKKDKNSWFVLKVGETAIAAAMLISAIYCTLNYKNDLIEPKGSVIMFCLMTVCILIYWWTDDKINNIASIIVVLGEAGMFILYFSKLCKSDTIIGMFNAFFRSMTVRQLLFAIAAVFAFLLLLSILLQYLKNIQILGKFFAIICVCIVSVIFTTLLSIEKKTQDAMGVAPANTTKTEEYCVFVLKSDPANELKDVTGYPIAYTMDGNDEAMSKALNNLKAQAKTTLNLVEKNNLSEVADALYDGSVKAVFMDRAYSEMIDAEYEAREIERIFSEDTKSVAVISIDFVIPVEPDATPVPPRPTAPPKDLSIEPFVLYLSGIDTFGAITTKSRSDVNVLVVVNPKTKEIAMVTTPRDAYVDIPGKTKDMRDKLTHAGNYGVDYSMSTLENLYGVPINHYVRVNFTSVEGIVDILGGVDVVSLYDFTARHGKYHFNKGVNHMNGSQALSFARERKTVQGGDITRGKHHIELVKGLISKVTSSAVLQNYQSLLGEVSKNIQTDITLEQITELVAMQMSDNKEWHITTYAAVGEGDMRLCDCYRSSKLWVSILDENSVRKASLLMVRVLNGEHIADGEYQYDE